MARLDTDHRSGWRLRVAAAIALLPLITPVVASASVAEGVEHSAAPAPSALGVPSRLVVFLPETVYADHPFDIPVWIADDGRQLVKEGTSALVTLTVDAGPMAGPAAVLTCPGGLSTRSDETGPNAGLALFSGCTVLRAGDFIVDATASDVRSRIVPAPTIAPDTGVALHALASTEAPQEAIELTADSSGLPYAVVPWKASITLRVRFTEHGANQRFQLQASPRTTSTWQAVADLETDANGGAAVSVRPSVSTWYRVVFAGSPMLAAGRSRLFTAAVQLVATQRPVNTTPRVIPRGATIRFETTVRPVVASLPAAKVSFQIWHRVAGQWRLASTRTRSIDSSGVAKVNITFGGTGDWYVRSLARSVLAPNPAVVPDVPLAALGQSESTPISRIRVR
jgi:hypothetical protein